MKIPHEFYLETNGRIIDVDHEYGGQCWDLFALFCLEYCNKTFGCIETGYVIDLWNHFDEIGLGEYFEKIPFEKYHELQDGDWLIWDKKTNPLCWITNYSHIAMFRKYNDSNPEQNIILTQNPNGNPNYIHQMVCDFLGFVGALRPKCYIKEEIIQTAVEIPKEEISSEKDDEIVEDWDNDDFELEKQWKKEDEELAIELINSDKESVILFILEKICNLIRKITEIIFRKDNEK